MVMSLAMGIYNDGMQNIDKMIPELRGMGFEVNDCRTK